jgi:FtsP/CotA-like multicopper oxidase with cupredoxin domain
MAVTTRTCFGGGDHPHPETALELSCLVRKEGSPVNPTIIGPPDPGHSFIRKVFNSKDVTMPDGVKARVWGFEDENQRQNFPSTAIRVKQDKLVNVRLESTMSVHTIHFHGIEPEDCNDGVGHTSFEISGNYVYQWRATTAGTYFYHCHVNTTLHFHMGLWGGLIVDPPEWTTTNKVAYEGGPRYDVEAVWPFHSIDMFFREINHAGGLCDTEDVGLNVYRPKYFLVDGSPHPNSRTAKKATVRVGQTLLARIICADYFPQKITFGGLTGTVIAGDGRPLDAADHYPVTQLELTSAERNDVLFKPTTPGQYTVRCETYDWIDRTKVAGVCETVIDVIP